MKDITSYKNKAVISDVEDNLYTLIIIISSLYLFV